MLVAILKLVYPRYLIFTRTGRLSLGEGVSRLNGRSSACLVGHLSPPMTTAGLYDEFEELEALLDEHSHFEQEHPESVSDIENVIREKAMACHLIDEEQGAAMGDGRSYYSCP